MKHKIEVESRAEGEAVEKLLGNPVTRAIVVIEGVLSELSEKEAHRVLDFVIESRGNDGD